MQNEEKTANYIGEAVILLTADHLGIETEMLDTAKEVWRTKRLPDAPLLGYYASAARKVCEAVLAKGLGERADRLGQVFYMTGEFPEPCQIVRVQGLSDDLCTARCAGRLHERRRFESLEHLRTLRSAPLVRTSGELLPRKRHRRE